ncbi:leucine-rich repeat-containing protein 15-like [Culicoides brevitarsis]|uniref:leucine-rich repeat-containing protein 15-like n=1 Tax=Culicoides brevitarsis TaxID=469753 RepID=UPI00307C0B2F
MMTNQAILRIFLIFVVKFFTGCGTNEILLDCDVSETHTTKNSCSFTTTTCIIEEFRDVWQNQNVKLSFTNAREENFTSLVFQNSFVSTLPKEIFDQFPHLESLDMSNTGLTQIRGRTFVNATDLVELNLMRNQLTDITTQTFVGATNLRALHLAHNRIVTIWSNAFRDAKQLEFIDLGHNVIQLIHKETFSMLDNLRNIYLYHNKIIDVNPLSFVHNKKLNTIDLTGNHMREVELDLSTPRLNKLDLSDCFLDELVLRKSTEATENITIRYLNLRKNTFTNISNIRIDRKEVQLQTVDLSENKLHALNIPPDFVQDITLFKLMKNDLWEISPGFMTSMKKLKSLYLDKNAFRLYENMFKPVPDLKILSISGNHLKFFDFSWFDGLSNLTQLNLEDNRLRQINYTQISNTLPSLQSFYLDKNEFKCAFVEQMVNYVRNTTDGKNIEFSSNGRGLFPTCVPDDEPSNFRWEWMVVGIFVTAFVVVVAIFRRQLIEKIDDVRRRFRSYSNMRETENGVSGGGGTRLRDDGDDQIL